MKHFVFILALFVLAGCREADYTVPKFEIGDIVVHSLTSDSLMVLENHNTLSTHVWVRTKEYERIKVDVRELKKVIDD